MGIVMDVKCNDVTLDWINCCPVPCFTGSDTVRLPIV